MVEKAIALKWSQHFLFGWCPAKKANKLLLTALLLVRETKDTSFGQRVSELPTTGGSALGRDLPIPSGYPCLPKRSTALGPTGTLRHSVAQHILSRTLGQCHRHLQELPDAFFGEDAKQLLSTDKCVSILEGQKSRAVQEWSIVFLSCQPIWERGFHTSDRFQLRAKAVHNNPLNGLSA